MIDIRNRTLMATATLLGLSLLAAGCGDSTVGVESAGVTVTPQELSYSQVILGDSASQTVTIESSGTAPLVIDQLFVDANTDDLKPDFDFPGRIEIAPGDSLILSVLYEPTEILQASGDLVIGTNVRDREEIRVPIVTPPLAPVIVVFPNPIDFGSVPEGSENVVTVSVRNQGSAPANITDISISGSSEFAAPALESIAYPLALDVWVADDVTRQTAYTFDVVYEPQTPGADEAVVSIAYNSINGTRAQIDLLGEAGAPTLSCAPDPIDFGPSPLALTTRQTVTCTNNGQVALNLSMISLDPNGDPAYALANVPPTLSEPGGTLTLPIGSSIPFIVEYTPPIERSNVTQVFVDYEISGVGDRESLIVSGVGVDNRCPIAVPVGFIRDDPNQRRSNQIDWATPTDILILDATRSSDPDGQIVDYEWELSRSPQGTTTALRAVDGQEGNDALRQFFIPLQGRYEFTLRVFDDVGFQDCDDPAVVTVISLPDEAIHIELTWTNPQDPDESDDAGSDVDLHLVKMPANWFSEFDNYFANDEPNWGPELPSLDIDDTDGAGPENIQMDNPVDCQWYALGVHYFEKQFGTAYATVRIFIEAEQVAEFVTRPLRDTDDFWDVGRLHWPTGEFFGVDEVYKNFDSSSATPPALTPEMVESIGNTGICN